MEKYAKNAVQMFGWDLVRRWPGKCKFRAKTRWGEMLNAGRQIGKARWSVGYLIWKEWTLQVKYPTFRLYLHEYIIIAIEIRLIVPVCLSLKFITRVVLLRSLKDLLFFLRSPRLFIPSSASALPRLLRDSWRNSANFPDSLLSKPSPVFFVRVALGETWEIANRCSPFLLFMLLAHREGIWRYEIVLASEGMRSSWSINSFDSNFLG